MREEDDPWAGPARDYPMNRNPVESLKLQAFPPAQKLAVDAGHPSEGSLFELGAQAALAQVRAMLEDAAGQMHKEAVANTSILPRVAQRACGAEDALRAVLASMHPRAGLDG